MSKRPSVASSRASSRVGSQGRERGAAGGPGGAGISHVASKDASGRMVEFSSMDDQCPVCKSDRFLNPRLRLLVGPCYHKMCESCIDRLFTLGPSPCPVCGQTLRKAEFSAPTFEDLAVEKEVAIRRRIGRFFNKREEDFETLKEYNDYLEEVEEITFNLINEVDVEATNAKIRAFEQANRESIIANLRLAEQEAKLAKEEEERLRLERKGRAELARLAEEREREEHEREKRELVQALERSDAPASRVVAQARAVAFKRSSAAQRNRERLESSSDIPLHLFSGGPAKASDTAEPADSWTPASLLDFEGPLAQWDDYSEIYELRPSLSDYQDAWHEGMQRDEKIWPGGYEMSLAFERELRAAVEGLGMRNPGVPLASGG